MFRFILFIILNAFFINLSGRVGIRNVLNTGAPLQHHHFYQEEDEVVDEEEVDEVEEEEEAGRYEAWWQEQLERRVRVAQTCVRSSFLPKFNLLIFSTVLSREGIVERADRNTFLYDPDHRLLFCRNAKVYSNTH